MIKVSGEAALADFRHHWSGERLLEVLADRGGRLRIPWAVGVGKSTAIDDLVETAILGRRYDLVIVLVPTRQLIDERRWIRLPPDNVCIVNLQPRPRTRCGPTVDRLWADHERNQLGALGRITLCGPCPERRACPWPDQFGARLKGTQVVYATQAHLERAPDFIRQLTDRTQAGRTLVLLDEVGFVMKSVRRTLSAEQLHRFQVCLQTLSSPASRSQVHARWCALVDLLLRAPTADLRSLDWQPPGLSSRWVYAVQVQGWERFGRHFSFLGYELRQFCRSPLASRERLSNGGLQFASPPTIPGDFMVFSGTAQDAFLAYRLGTDFASPFREYRFEHPQTTWYNLASRIGTRKYFPGNADQILDFFASLTHRRIAAGKRVMLITKQAFVAFCAREIEIRLRTAGLTQVQVLTRDWQALDQGSAPIVPIIHFGLIGTNRFEHFDCAYCLCGYYVNADVVNAILQDVLASDSFIPITLSLEGEPLRRRAHVTYPEHRDYDVHRLAQQALDHQEMDVVLQAVGRVRPYTKPREIITFQCAEHPSGAYTREFRTLGEARQFFDIPGEREQRLHDRKADVLAAKAEGLTQAATARRLGLSLRTVKRHWHKGDSNPLRNSYKGLVAPDGGSAPCN